MVVIAASKRRIVLVVIAMCVLPMVMYSEQTSAGHRPANVHVYLREEVERTIANLRELSDFAGAKERIDRAFDTCIGFVRRRNPGVYSDVVFARRLIGQLGALDDKLLAMDLLVYLNENRGLGESLVFAVKPKEENLNEVYGLLDRLRRARPDKVPEYATLAAAICLVHDKPLVRRVNENHAEAEDPLVLFDYFVKHESQMLFGIRNVPAELLVYVVDAAAPVQELEWALKVYGGDREVGMRFFDVPYDHDYLRLGTKKKVNVAGWSLPNIRAFGGVCADQAYFASTVGKAIGVPTAIAGGRASVMGHAWVGFIQSTGKRAAWNFNIGRYSSYQGVRGAVMDPQTRRQVPDSYVSLLARYVVLQRSKRYQAVALVDAAERLLMADEEQLREYWDAERGISPWSFLRRKSLQDEGLRLLEEGLKICPAYAAGWLVVRDLAERGRLDLAGKEYWARALYRLCAREYPDFYMDALEPMIAAVGDVKKKEQLWGSAFNLFSGKRHDLAAEVRMEQAAMWEKEGEKGKAFAYYREVVARYANSGPFAVTALKQAERILADAGKEREVLSLYRQAFSSIRKPGRFAEGFVRQSNWYRVGTMFANRLEAAGLRQQAARVRKMLEEVVVPKVGVGQQAEQ